MFSVRSFIPTALIIPQHSASYTFEGFFSGLCANFMDQE